MQPHTESLLLDSLLDPSTQPTKIPQPESRAEHTNFTRLFANLLSSALYSTKSQTLICFCDTDLNTLVFKMPKLDNNMYNNSDKQLFIMKAAIEPNKQDVKCNKQDSDDKITNVTKYFK